MTVQTHTHKGGRPTPIAAGMTLPHRDTLWERIQALPSGALFTTQDILQEDAVLADDFAQMRDYDYVHVGSGLFTGIQEGPYVRSLPSALAVASNWLARFDDTDTLSEFGDWTAWRMKLYPWEPIAGYRFRCNTPKAVAVLSLGHMKIRLKVGPVWLQTDSPEYLLLRALHDMPHKTVGTDVYQWMGENTTQKLALLERTTDLAKSLDEAWETAPEETRGQRPLDCVDIAWRAWKTEIARRKK